MSKNSNITVEELDSKMSLDQLYLDGFSFRSRTRNIVPDPSSWKSEIRKNKHQAGEAYISRRGKQVPAKSIKTFKNCINNCMYKCSTKIDNDERLSIFKSFYSLKTNNEKRQFLLENTSRHLTLRPKIQENDAESQRKYTFRYYFNVKGENIQVCKQFFLGTLSISQKPVYNAHQKKIEETNTPEPDMRGKNSRRTCTGDTDFVREHINSFPKVDSDCCEAGSSRQYLDGSLSIAKMYDLYVKKCEENNINPVKHSMYHKIFVTEFNLGFHKPKNDRRPVCKEIKVGRKRNSSKSEEQFNYDNHTMLNSSMSADEDKDDMELCDDRITYIKKMIQFMSDEDKTYYKELFQIQL